MIFKEFPAKMKNFASYLSLILLLGLVLSSFAFTYNYFVTAKESGEKNKETRQISVSGEGKVAAKPDTAVFTTSVITSASKVTEAQLENTRRSNAVLAFLKEKGIDNKDIKTVGYSIYPQYQYYPTPICAGVSCPPPRSPKIVSYQVQHTFEIKVRDLEKTDDLLSGIVANGANEVGSVNFKIDDENAVKEEARRKAIEDAKTKAEVLAKDLGVRLGKIINFSESGAGVPIYTMGAQGFGKGGGMTAAPSPQIQPGEQEIVSDVTITYELK